MAEQDERTKTAPGRVAGAAEPNPDAREAARQAGETARAATDQFAWLFNMAPTDGRAAVDRMTRSTEALAACNRALTEGAQTVMAAWMDYAREAAECGSRGIAEVMRARNPSDLMAAQTELFRSEVEVMLRSGRRIADISRRAVEDASERLDRERVARG